MATEDVETLGTLSYYMLEKYYRHVQMFALDATRRFGSDPVLSLFKGISMLGEERIQEGVRELEPIKDKQNVTIAVHYALSHASQLGSSSKESLQQLSLKIDHLRKNPTDLELYYAVLVEWFIGDTKNLKELSDQLLQSFPEFKQGIILRSWIDINSDSSSVVKKGIKTLEPALDETDKDPFAYLAKARGYAKFGKYRVVLDSLNQVAISFPKFTPGMVELMRAHLAQNSWDEVIEVSSRLLSVSSHHPDALRMQILFAIGREGKYLDGANRLGELIQVIDRFEPQNGDLYVKSAQVFSRICGRNNHILSQTYTLVERSVNIRNDNSQYTNELAYQLFLSRKYKDATKCYQNAMAIDETSIPSLIGLLRCQAIEYDESKQSDSTTLKDMKDQIEFLDQVYVDPEVLFLKAFYARASGKPHKKVLDYLREAWIKIRDQFEKRSFSVDSLISFNPDFIMEIINELFKLSPTQPVLTGQAPPPALVMCLEILETLCKVIPGLFDAYYKRAKTQFLLGNVDEAILTLKHVLEQDETFADGHLLLAQIHQHKGNHSTSSQYLDTALSFNFAIREHPLYHLIKARSLRLTGNAVDAIQTLKLALSLPGVKRPASSKSKQKKAVVLDDNDRLSIFLELVEAHTANNEHHEAAKVMQDAMNVFQGTPEEVRVRVANADLSVSRDNVEQALLMLRSITPDQPYYIQAVEKMAHIYLNHKKDKKLYAACYKDLCENQPSAHTYLLLGDAYISIQEPHRAIEVYEKALAENPKEGVLASKIGQTLIKTHEYKKAIAYYEKAITNGQTQLQFDLVDLLLKMKNYQMAAQVLNRTESHPKNDLDSLIDETRRLLLLSTLSKECMRPEEEFQPLKSARETQAKVLKRAQVEQPDSVPAQKRVAADICRRLANYSCNNENNLEQAIKYNKEALIYCPDDTKIMLEMARLHMQVGDLDSCQQYCMQALKVSEDGQDQASMMMADIMFTKKQYDDAIYHYQQLLQNKPDHYEALARLIGLLRRGGQLERVPHFLSLAEEKSGEGKAAMDAGYQYCKGLLEWYSGRPHDALQHFNQARCDSEWCEKALEGMIRICLNPDQQTLGGEAFENLGENSADQLNMQNAALSTAERLVKEYKSNDPYKNIILQNMVMVSTKQKPKVERALASFVEICQKKKDHVPSLLGTAIAYQVLKQTPKARNQLKRISKMPWTSEEAEDFEQAWLLLADVYITAGKYDMATDLLKKCLEHNKSSCKAYEYLGFIYEKEQSYKDAAEHYQRAWLYSNKSNPVIGYKLGFNYLKARRYVDAIEVSHKVLELHPDYPRIRKEILDKARSNIRV